jgi:phospholipid/cholesterol/gamma-HCH transport system substrate-binding protein
MPRTRSLAFSQLKIGLVTVAALVLATVMIFLVGGQGGFFWQRYPLKTKFSNVQGLKEGGLVRVAGVEVGQVKHMEFVGSDIEVTMQVLQSMRSRITTNSRAMLGSLSLLGEAVIDISASSSGEPLPDWGFVPSAKTPGQLSDVAAGASEGIEEITKMLKDVRAGKGTLGKLVTDEQLYRELNAFIASADNVVANINKGHGTLGQLVNDPAAYRSLNASLQNLSEMTARINAGEGSLGKLLKDDAFAKSLSSTTANLNELSGKINKGEGTAGKLVTDPALYNRLNSITDRLDGLVSHLNEGQGTAGQLLHDKQLYENMNGAANELRGLIGDIRKDPKKYLNVRVSIF